MWWKATLNVSGLLPEPHPVYAAAKKIKWPSFNILKFDLKKKYKVHNVGGERLAPQIQDLYLYLDQGML